MAEGVGYEEVEVVEEVEEVEKVEGCRPPSLKLRRLRGAGYGVRGTWYRDWVQKNIDNQI